jgi:hypothetical protein
MTKASRVPERVEVLQLRIGTVLMVFFVWGSVIGLS